jgi:3-hydroxyisobutyrate dehydrogenase
MEPLRVGIVGVGRMGGAMARRLAGAHDVRGFDVRSVTDVPITMVDTPARLAEWCDVILSALPSPVETRALLDEAAFRTAFIGGRCLLVDTSTSDPASIRALADGLTAEAAARLLDAPVLGRPERCGAWTMPVGGDAAALTQARPVLEPLAARLEHVGPLGAGHAVKLLNNLMFAAINVVTAEAVAACDALGVDAERFVELVGGSQAATVSPLFRDLAPRMVGHESETVFTVALLAKDLQLAARMCEDAGATLVSARASQIVTSQALRMGLGDEDSAALVRWYRRGGARAGT